MRENHAREQGREEEEEGKQEGGWLLGKEIPAPAVPVLQGCWVSSKIDATQKAPAGHPDPRRDDMRKPRAAAPPQKSG